MDGLVLVNKPRGFTSFDVVAVVRGLLHTKKIGHTGTLDPMATGVLPLMVGKATRLCDRLPDHDKSYIAALQVGLTTDTQDSTGKVLTTAEAQITAQDIQNLLPEFTGPLLQVPPMYSAVSVNGVRLYDLARQGKTVEREARPITVHRLELLEADEAAGRFRLAVDCSKGTYIRTLIHDLGQRLGCGAVMTELCRTRACGFDLTDCFTVDQLRTLPPEQWLLPVERAVAGFAPLTVTAPQAVRFANGGPLSLDRLPLGRQETGLRRVYAPDGTLLGLGEIRPESDQLAISCLL